MTETFEIAGVSGTGKAVNETRGSATSAKPSPIYSGETGDAGHGANARKRQDQNASVNNPRKGRQKASQVPRKSANSIAPSDDTFPDVATRNTRESATTRTPIGEILHNSGKANVSPCKSATHHEPAAVVDLIGLVRTRRTWQQARNRLYLHALSVCRSAANGDKAEAVKLYKATASGDDIRLLGLVGPMIEDIERWDARLVPVEKRIVALFDGLPIAAMVKETRGLGALSVATLIGMTGPLDQYASVNKVWRLCGLGVNAEGTGRESLIVPGECDRRPKRAAVYVLAAGAIKASNPELRTVYDREKAKALGKGWTKARSHNHAMRYVGKFIVRRMWKTWRAGVAP
jgi:hypothetical protein